MNNTTELTVVTELTDIARFVRDFQIAENLNDTEIVRKFTNLGSTKTYKLILDGKIDGLDAERWLTEYRQTRNAIDAIRSGSVKVEKLYEDLTTCARVRVAVADAMQEHGNARLVLVEGPSGSGKTHTAKALAARFGRKILTSEADETWKESPNAMMAGILRALKFEQIPTVPEQRLAKILAKFNESEYVFIIDEAHHLGPRTLNLVKTFMNKSPVVIVLCAMATLFRRLEMAAYEEARQLTQNRLCERVLLGEIDKADVEVFLRELKWVKGELEKSIVPTVNAATTRGYFAYVKSCVKIALREHGADPITFQEWSLVLTKAANKR